MVTETASVRLLSYSARATDMFHSNNREENFRFPPLDPLDPRPLCTTLHARLEFNRANKWQMANDNSIRRYAYYTAYNCYTATLLHAVVNTRIVMASDTPSVMPPSMPWTRSLTRTGSRLWTVDRSQAQLG